jgi:uncharacterized repeat protein (TIGR01451 family)
MGGVLFVSAIASAQSISATSTTSSPSDSVPTSTGLQVTNTVDNAAPHEGDTVTYTITVEALGQSTSTDIVAIDVLPTGLTLVNATASQGSYASSTGVWAVGDLPPNSSATLVIAAAVNPGTTGQTLTDSATVSESSFDIQAGTNTSASASVSITIVQATSTATVTTGTALNLASVSSQETATTNAITNSPPSDGHCGGP